METVGVAVHTSRLTWDTETGLKSESQPGLRSEFQTCLGCSETPPSPTPKGKYIKIWEYINLKQTT